MPSVSLQRGKEVLALRVQPVWGGARVWECLPGVWAVTESVPK